MLAKELNNVVTLFYSDCSCYNNIQSNVIELENVFKRKSLTKFKQKDIEKYFKYLKLKNNSNSTINGKLVFLSKALKYYKNTLVMPYQKVKNKEKQIITETQFEYLLDVFQNNQEMIQFLNLAYYTGLRANEILKIRQQHIVNEADTYYLNLYNTKNHKDNFIPLSTRLITILVNYKEFTLDYKQVYYNLKKYKVTAHQFRHTFITKCYEKGLDTFSIMKLTNQTSLSVHQRYNHISNKRLKELIEVI